MAKQGKWFGEQGESGGVNGLLDKGCKLDGKLNFEGVMQINGDFCGEIVSSGTLVVGPDAHVQGTIKVNALILDGTLEGNVDATSRLELHATGRLLAEVITRSFLIEEGGIFHGSCQMMDAKPIHLEKEGIKTATETFLAATGSE